MNDDRTAPATKGDIQDLKAEMKAELKGEIGGLRAEFKADMQALESRLVETFRDMQTEMLKAVYSVTESHRQWFGQLEGNQSTLIGRVGTLEDRVTELERKNLPKPPQE